MIASINYIIHTLTDASVTGEMKRDEGLCLVPGWKKLRRKFFWLRVRKVKMESICRQILLTWLHP